MTSLRMFTLTAILLAYAPCLLAQSNVKALNLTFTTIDVPGAVETNPSGINSNGDVVGWYVKPDNSASGFLLKAGVFTYLNYPGASDTVARGINDSGLIVGYAELGNSVIGFEYDGKTFTKIRVGSYPTTYGEGLNGMGDIVGGFGFGASQGFEISGTKHKTITPPGSYATALATGINNLGQVVGWTDGSTGLNGFLYNRGKFQTLSFPGSNMTNAWEINDDGIIVGGYLGCAPGCANHGFVLMRGRYLSFDYPGAMETYAFGVNSAGQIVGSYTFDQETFHGFVTNAISDAPFVRSRVWHPY